MAIPLRGPVDGNQQSTRRSTNNRQSTNNTSSSSSGAQPRGTTSNSRTTNTTGMYDNRGSRGLPHARFQMAVPSAERVAELERELHYIFQDKDLLISAMTRRLTFAGPAEYPAEPIWPGDNIQEYESNSTTARQHTCMENIGNQIHELQSWHEVFDRRGNQCMFTPWSKWRVIFDD